MVISLRSRLSGSLGRDTTHSHYKPGLSTTVRFQASLLLKEKMFFLLCEMLPAKLNYYALNLRENYG